MDRYLALRMKDKKKSRKVAQEYDVRQTKSPSKRFKQKLLEQLVPQLIRDVGKKKEAVILDVATGTGKIPLILADTYRDIFAIDISEEMVRVAREKVKVSGNKNIYFQITDARKLPFLSNSFDVVTSFSFFSLLPKQIWYPIIQEMYRVVKPGGTIIIELNSPFHGVFLTLYRYLFKKKRTFICPIEDRFLFSNYTILRKIGIYLPMTYFVSRVNINVGKFMLQLAKRFPFNWLCRSMIYVCKKRA